MRQRENQEVERVSSLPEINPRQWRGGRCDRNPQVSEEAPV